MTAPNDPNPPAPPGTVTNSPGRKGIFATVATYALFAGALAIVNAIQGDLDVISGALPPLADIFVTPVLPALITLATTWLTKHAPEDLRLPVKHPRPRR